MGDRRCLAWLTVLAKGGCTVAAVQQAAATAAAAAALVAGPLIWPASGG